MFGLNLKPPRPAPPKDPPKVSGWSRGPEQCGNCRFSMELPEDPNSHGVVCRRFPPVWVPYPSANGVPRGQSVYPGVVSDFWCGEYQRRSS